MSDERTFAMIDLAGFAALTEVHGANTPPTPPSASQTWHADHGSKAMNSLNASATLAYSHHPRGSVGSRSLRCVARAALRSVVSSFRYDGQSPNLVCRRRRVSSQGGR
jgi:hypothetical protein